MYDDEEEVEEKGNFLTNFYYTNKVLVWIFIGIILFIILMSILTKGGSTKQPEITYNVEISPAGDVHVNIGRSTNLSATVTNDPNAIIIWSVENSDIATVDNGNVRGLDYGKTTVTATYIDDNNEKHFDTKNIIVSDGDSSVELTDVSFKKGDLYMPLNDTYKVSLTLVPSNGYVENEAFTSSNNSIVTIDNNGVITSIGEGHAIVYFDVNNGQFRKELNVYVDRSFTKKEIFVAPNKISFDGELRKMKIGDTEKLSFTVKPQDADVTRLIWKSSNEDIVTVDNGTVKALKDGRAVITVSALNGETEKIDIEVEKNIIDVTSIDVKESLIELKVGQSMTISPVVKPTDASNKVLKFSSANESVAIVEANETGTKATIKGIKSGSTIIIIKSSNNVRKLITVKVISDEKDEPVVTPTPTVEPTPTSNGNSGGGGGGSSSSKGFKISSSDANGEKYVTNDYYGGKQNNNGATAPVTITVEKIDSSVNKLVIQVCFYSSPSCGGLGNYTTYNSQSFTLKNVGEYVIRIEEYDANNNRIRVTNRYLWIRNGESNPTVSIDCDGKTQFTVGEEFYCYARNLSSDDSVLEWRLQGIKQSSTNSRIRFKAVKTGVNDLTVVTKKNATATIRLTFVSP